MEKMKNIDKDSFLEDHIKIVGSFGTYQIFLFLLQTLTNINAYEFLWIIFVGYTPEHFCDFELNGNFSQIDKQKIGIPKLSNGDYSSCLMYNISNQVTFNVLDINTDKLIQLHNESETIACDRWQYEFGSVGPTVVTDNDWVCDKSTYFLITLSCIGFAKLVGGLFGGYVTDWLGRKKSYMIYLSFKLLGTLISVAVPNQYAFIFGQFLNNFANINFLYVTTVILIESTEMRYRNIVGMLSGMSWVIGTCILPLIAYVCGHWKYLLWSNISVNLLFYFALFILKESPRWLFMQKKFDEYQNVMNYIARLNRRSNTIISVDHFMDQELNDDKVSIIQLFKTREMRRRTLLLATIWFTVGMIFYAIYLNVGELSGNIFMNTFLMAIVDVPVWSFSTWLMDRPSIGRRYTHLILFTTSLLSSLFMILIIEFFHNAIAVNVFSLLCKATASAAWGTMAMFSNELFPTSLRVVGLMTGTAIAEGASILSPYMFGILIHTWVHFPYAIMGVLSLIAVICIFVLPETFNKPLPQTVEDVENYKKQKVSSINGGDEKL